MHDKLRIQVAVATFTFASIVAAGHAQSTPPAHPPTQAQVNSEEERVARLQRSLLARLKSSLDSPDIEFKVLEPKLLRVMMLTYQQSIGFSAVMRAPRGLNGPVATVLPPSEVQKARMDLQDALDNKDVTIGEIIEKLKVFRATRVQAKADLLAAQNDLRDYLTLRQECVLVGMGLLD